MDEVIGVAAGISTSDKETTVSAGADQATTTRPTLSHVQVTSPPTTPLTTVTTVAPVGTQQRPVPLGEALRLPDPPWTVRVVSVTANGNEVVARENRFNKAPESGEQFFLVRLELTYNGAASAAPSDLGLAAVGAERVVYEPFRDSCGVIPNSFSGANTLLSGGTIMTNVCWSIREADAATLVLVISRRSMSGTPTVFALR